MTKRQLILAAVLLILPTVALSGIVAKNEIDKSNARTWRVKITGYDPRDLLYGHYLNFRFDWGMDIGHCVSKENCCLCIESKEGSSAPVVTEKTCGQAASCTSYIDVSPFRCEIGTGCGSVGFDPRSQQRYFIPEESAQRLNTLLVQRDHKMAVDLKITPTGKHMLGDLYIEGMPWKEYLNKNPEAGKAGSQRARPQSVAPSTPMPPATPPVPSEPLPEDSE